MKFSFYTLVILVGFLTSAVSAEPIPAGAARIEISPTGPVQLINIKEPTESGEVAQNLFARALAIGDDSNVVVLVSFDGIGVPGSLAESVAADLKQSHPFLSRDRIAICATHTHWAPHLTDLLGNIYGGPLPKEHQKRVDDYTQFLRHKLTAVATEALANRSPSHLSWSKAGKVTFAANRRMEDGGHLLRDEEKELMITWNPNAPVDHSLPLLAVRDAGTDKLKALHFTYACHNVAISGSSAITQFPNAVHGDWAGLTQAELERRHPGMVAIGTIGCGGDQRPDFCGNEAVAMAHAREICDEADRVLAQSDAWSAITGAASTSMVHADLPLSPVPQTEKLKGYAAATEGGASTIARSFVARGLLRRLEQGKEPPTGVPFIAQSWQFPGDGPSFVFLSGEVCIDYQLRIKREYGPSAWPIAYANATPCYIVSERMLEKGGYEAGNSMFYYGWLRPLEKGTEEKVMEAVAKVLR